MRYSTITLLLPLLLLSCIRTPDHPSEANKDKSIFQKVGFVSYEKVTFPEAKTVKEIEAEYEVEKSRMKLRQLEIKMKNAEASAVSGRKWFGWGLALLMAGIVLTFALKQYGLQVIGTITFGAGMAASCKGIVQQKIAENWEVATGAIVAVIAFIVIAFIFKDSGIDDKILKWIKHRKIKHEEGKHSRENKAATR